MKPYYVLFKKLNKIKSCAKEFVQTAIMVEHPESIFKMNYHVMEALLPAENPDRYIYLDNSNVVNILDYIHRGYNYHMVVDNKVNISPGFVVRLFKEFIPLWVKSCFIGLINKSDDIKKPFEWMVYNLILEKYIFKNYVCKNLPDSSFKLDQFKKNNVKTIFLYQDPVSMSLRDDISGHGFHRDIFFNLNYDIYVTPNKKVSDDFRRWNNVGEYVEIGIWSAEIVDQLRGIV